MKGKLLLAMLVGLLGLSVGGLVVALASNDVGDTATDFTLITQTGDSASLYDWLGKVVDVDFSGFA